MEEYVADVVDQEALRQFRKCKNRNILHLQHFCEENVVLLPCINAFEIVHVVIPGCCDACKRNEKLITEWCGSEAMHTCKVVAAYVRVPAKYFATKTRPPC